MTPMTIRVISDRPGWAHGLVASLPQSLRLVFDCEADITLVDGRTDWIARIDGCLAAGARRILLADPRLTTASKTIAALGGRVDAAGAVVTLSESAAGNPAVDGLHRALPDGIVTATCTSVADAPPRQTLFEQIRLLRAMGFGALETSAIHETPSALSAQIEGLRGAEPAHLRLLSWRSTARPPEHRFIAYSEANSARLDLSLHGEANPGRATLFDSAGLKIEPSIHEGALRHSLRRLLAETAPDCPALHELADDAALAEVAGK